MMMHENEILYAHECMITEGGLDNHRSDIHAYKATSDPDTLYYHQAMKESDADEFRVAMRKEWEDQRRNGNFKIIRRSEVPNGATILPSVWQLRRKREVSTGNIKKYKAKLNLYGSRMKKGIDYQLTYAPVLKWSSIRLTMLLTIINELKSVQLDYVHAYPHAPIEKEMYMKVPEGIDITEGGKGGLRVEDVQKYIRPKASRQSLE